MLSDRTLERVSSSYRRGYHDGYDGRQSSIVDNGIADISKDTIGGAVRPFADYDYEQGYKSGANDAHWALVYAGRSASQSKTA